MAYQSKADAELQEIWRGVTDEINRRATLNAVPTDIADLAARYRAAGGDPANLHHAIDNTGDDQ